MRIAFVPAARLFSDRRANGEALIAEAIVRGLAARGHEILAYCEEADFARPIDGVEIVEVPASAPAASLSRLAFARRIARDARERRFDVAHLLFPLSTDEGYALVRGVPLVCGPMFVAWPQRPRRTSRPLKRAAAAAIERTERLLHRQTLARASRLLVTGPRARAAVPERLQDRVSETPIGIDVARFDAAPLPEEPVVLFLSVFQQRKGLDVLLRAMPEVLKRVPRARLLVAGDDPAGMRPAFEAQARAHGLDGAVKFVGPVDPAEAPALLAKARVFCQPSLGEPYGMTILEAMACGRPVVSTDAGGVPDLVVDRRGGRLAPVGDVRLLADALVSVLCNPAHAAQMGAFNRARAEQAFSLDRSLDLIEQAYDAVLAGRAEGRPVVATS